MKQDFRFRELDLSGALLIEPFVSCDRRGCFIKDYSKTVFEKHGVFHDLDEVFYTRSNRGVVRAIHFQRVKEQAKLVRCISGKVFDVIVDLRKESTTFGHWRGFWLSEDNCNEVYVPGQFGHGYMVVEPAIVSYKCSEKFYGEYDDGIIWNDSEIGITWPLEMSDKICLSERDERLQTFREFRQKKSWD